MSYRTTSPRKRGIGRILLLAMLILLVLTSCVDSISLSTRIFAQTHSKITMDYASVISAGPRFYGVEYHWIDQDRELYLQRYRQLHGNVVRVQISQEIFEPVNDNTDPNISTIEFSRTIPFDIRDGKTLSYGDMFSTLAREFPGLHFQINIWLAARWNAANPDGYMGLGGAFPPRDYAEHREFVREIARWLVGTCGIAPERLSFTFTNEPNLAGFFVGTQSDLIRMAVETRTALDEVSPLIQMGGLDEVHGTSWTDTFYLQRPSRCCDFWTYHVYERGVPVMLNALFNRADRLRQYGPVWVTEFADTANGSPDGKMDFSTPEAALGFAEMLGRLWPSGIDGIIHFRLSDTYADVFGGWVGHGLFADARGTHSNGQAYAPFPSYWVFANMYREFGGGEVVAVSAPTDLAVVAARKTMSNPVQLAVWVTNSTVAGRIMQVQLTNFPSTMANVRMFDNLLGDTPVETYDLNGEPLVIELALPPRSSRMLVFTPAPRPHAYILPLILTALDREAAAGSVGRRCHRR